MLFEGTRNELGGGPKDVSSYNVRSYSGVPVFLLARGVRRYDPEFRPPESVLCHPVVPRVRRGTFGKSGYLWAGYLWAGIQFAPIQSLVSISTALPMGALPMPWVAGAWLCVSMPPMPFFHWGLTVHAPHAFFLPSGENVFPCPPCLLFFYRDFRCICLRACYAASV